MEKITTNRIIYVQGGSLRRVFRARGKLVGTSDFVVSTAAAISTCSLNVTALRCAVVAARCGSGARRRRGLGDVEVSSLGLGCQLRDARRWRQRERSLGQPSLGQSELSCARGAVKFCEGVCTSPMGSLVNFLRLRGCSAAFYTAQSLTLDRPPPAGICVADSCQQSSCGTQRHGEQAGNENGGSFVLQSGF